MKHRISISINEETLLALREKIRQSNGTLRSKSHAVEVALRRFVADGLEND